MVYRANIPAELDFLDSPLLSPTPIGSALLGNVPGSALAERIFNDPSAWETDDTPGGEDPMAWFIEEVEKFKFNSSAQSSAASTADGSLRQSVGLRLMDLNRHHIRPISLVSLFDRTAGDEYAKDFIPNTADFFSPSSDASSAPVDITDFISPAPIYSASTTLSFLDLYLESPGKGGIRKSLYQAKSRPRTPLIQISTDVGEGRPLSLFSPMLGHPDMSVEPLKRGSSVPPLDQMPQRAVVAAASPSPPPPTSSLSLSSSSSSSPPPPPPESILSPEPKLALPPGLSQPADVSSSSTAPPVTKAVLPTTPPRKLNKSRGSPPRSLPRPVLPPPYSRESSASPSAGAKIPLPSAAASTSSSATPSPAGTPVRRLPTIPPALHSMGSTPVTSVSTSTFSTKRTASPLPLPSSLLSPEPAPSPNQRPLSGVRSPLGPRTRTSAIGAAAERKTPSPARRGPSGLVGRRPPVLHL